MSEEKKPIATIQQKESQGKEIQKELKAETDNNGIKDTVAVSRVTE